MNTKLKAAISLANSGKKVPVMQLVRNDPEMAALISKLVTPRDTPQYGSKGEKSISNPDTFSFRNIAEGTSENIHDAETIMQLLPDMELWSQILISSILSPKDMMSTELTYIPPADLLPSDISSALINNIKNHFTKVYRIKPLLPDILKDILFNTGSYPVAVIPENALDDLINGSGKLTMESISNAIGVGGEIQPRGLLGPLTKSTQSDSKITGISFESLSFTNKDKVSLESCLIKYKDFSTCVYVNDNTDLLKVPLINQRIREQHVLNAIGSKSMESLIKLNDREVAGLVYKNKQPVFKSMANLKTDNQLHRRSVGEPLIIHIASEAVIPVHVPGSPDKQIGFFVLIDADGNPLTRASTDDQYRALSNKMNGGGNNNFSSAMINKVSDMMGANSGGGDFNPNNRMHVDYSVKAYSELIEADLLARLRNGVYGNGVALANNQEVYRIMMARTLEKQNTQLLFVPVELMTYFALRYNTNGIGKSLIDEMKILLSLRIMLMFSDVMASIKNSIGKTEVKLKLDEHDPDPKKTIETSIHEISRARQQYFPLGMNNPSDLVDWLQRAGLEFTFEGHPGLPDVQVEFGEKNSNYVKPDSDLEETLRKRSIMATGLNPETVDAGYNAEFATSIVANNILLSKRVIQIQEKFTPMLTDHLRKVIICSQSCTDGLKLIIKENLDKIKDKLTDEYQKQEESVIIDRIFYDFINGFEATLPAPNSITLDNQAAALKTYSESLEEVLDAYISDKFFTDVTGGDVAGDVTVIREVIKAYFIRKWVTENGMLPELSAITSTGEDGSPMINFFDEQANHIEALGKSLASLMVKLQAPKEEITQELTDGGVTPAEPEETPSDANGDGSGGDDMGFGDEMPDLGADETPTEGDDTAPEGTIPVEEPEADNEKKDDKKSDEEPAAT